MIVKIMLEDKNSKFLQYVAKDMLAKHGASGLANVAVIFPNKRASLFLNQALYEEAGHPVWSPAYFTISDLFRRHSTLIVPDQMTLVFRLYNIFVQETGGSEALDHFYSWGQLMLSDFDDIDKNLVDADKLFINLAAWEEMKDFSFLSEQQRKSLESFFGTVIADTPLQQRFNDIWQHLGQIYHAFRNSLAKDGFAYEGMLYRDVAEKRATDFHYKHYIFVGFNLLQKVEQKLFMRLKELGMAEFYWDYDTYYINGQHEAGRYIARYLDKFPNELSPERASAGIDTDVVYSNFSKSKDVAYISAPTEDIQARYVSTWLREQIKIQNSNHKSQSSTLNPQSNNTAIVLCDERLLQNVIHCLPEEVGDVNITTGYPLSASPASTFVHTLLNLQLKGLTDGGNNYRLKAVNCVLRHPYAKYLSDDCKALYDELNTHKNYYPSRQTLTEGREENVGLLFRMLDTSNGTLPIISWMTEILKQVGIGSRDAQDPLMHESVFRMYTLLQRLDDIMLVSTNGQQGMAGGKQMVSTAVLLRLLGQLIDTTSIPFHGEPALGIQVMGVLETRNLDFDHVLVLSCNEGNLPKGVDDASFIPHSIRKGYEMTTVENKVAIYSYYFHSLLQRANDITLTYNNSTEDGKQGEMSRFMLQYLVEKGDSQAVRRLTLQSGQNVSPISRVPIGKTGKVRDVLEAIDTLSPTAISRYLRCNLQFYFNIICGLREQDNDDEDEIDNATFGNIFHRTAELIYTHLSGDHHQHDITSQMIENLISDKATIERFLDQAFREKLFKIEDETYSNHKSQNRYNGLQLLNRNVLRLYIMRLLRLDQQTAPFRVLALEGSFYEQVSFEANGKPKILRLGGQIDRLDQVAGRLRVIDYKTGKPLSAAAPDIDEIFNPRFVDSKHSVYYLQVFLYSSIIRMDKEVGGKMNPQGLPVAPALLFIREAGDNYNPILKLKDKGDGTGKRHSYSTVDDIKDVYADYMDNLKALLSEIFDLNTPFRPTEFVERCDSCPYKDICSMTI